MLSVFAGALFLLHPVQTESVAYVASRSETMSVFFFLGAFAVFVYRERMRSQCRGSSPCSLLFGAACDSEGAYGRSAGAAAVDGLLLRHAVSVHRDSKQR